MVRLPDKAHKYISNIHTLIFRLHHEKYVFYILASMTCSRKYLPSYLQGSPEKQKWWRWYLYIVNKMKNKKYQTVGTFPKIQWKIVERDKINTFNTHIHDRSLSCHGTCTSMKKGRTIHTNNFFIGNFTILTQLCDFFVVFWPFF